VIDTMPLGARVRRARSRPRPAAEEGRIIDVSMFGRGARHLLGRESVGGPGPPGSTGCRRPSSAHGDQLVLDLLPVGVQPDRLR